MAAPIDSVRHLLAPMLVGWSMQLGMWRDPGAGVRSAVLRNAGGAGAQLVRRPAFTLMLIGAQNDTEAVGEKASEIVEAIRSNSGGLVYLEAGEPRFTPTADARPVYEIALSAISN